jgi:hypothetical protein
VSIFVLLGASVETGGLEFKSLPVADTPKFRAIFWSMIALAAREMKATDCLVDCRCTFVESKQRAVAAATI